MDRWPEKVLETTKRLRTVAQMLKDQFTGRADAVDLLVLAGICHEHVLLIGPPGTAKTGLIVRYCKLINATGFQYLLSRFTEPTELFGPLDLAAFQSGHFSIRTDGMLPTAQIAFLDEVFEGSSPILNSLLTLVNERVFYNGSLRQNSPLISLIGASNLIPEDPWLKAFADRFLLRLEVKPTPENEIDDLLERGWLLEAESIQSAQLVASGGAPIVPIAPLKVDELMELNSRILEVNLNEVRSEYSRLIRELRAAEGVELSDRRIVKSLKLIAAAALLEGRTEAQLTDFWPLLHIWTRPEEADRVRAVVEPRLSDAGKQTSRSRPLPEILEDLEVLVDQERFHRTDSAWGAHLVGLNKLRREVINTYPSMHDARKRIEQAIQRGLQKMGTVHV
jgi:MoxR-like ATPase